MKKIRKPCGFHCVRIRHMSVALGGQRILEDVSLHLHCGQLMAVIGRNGAGKSTLVRAVLDDIPHEGTVEFRDTENGAMRKIRMGYVPQSLNVEPGAPMDVYDLMVSFSDTHPVFWRKKAIHEKMRETLKEFEADGLLDKPVGRLSGGELQRVLLSLAVMDAPNLLLLDEPVSGIDKKGMDLFYEKMDYLRSHYDMAILLISHDLDYVARYADRVVLLDQTVLEEGTPKEVFESRAFREVFGETSYTYGRRGDVLQLGRSRKNPRAVSGKEMPYEAGYQKRKEPSHE